MLAIESLVEYSAKEIEEFSKNLKKFENNKNFEKTGIFLSALANLSPDEIITLKVGDLGWKINYIGYRNQKTLIVDGDCGDFTGFNMTGGEIRVKGKIKSLGKNIEGRIYKNNKLIYPRWTKWMKLKLKKLLMKFGPK